MADPRSGSEDRTESATPRRRERAREQGQIARSADLGSAAALLAGTLALATGGSGLMQRLSVLMAGGTGAMPATPWSTGDAVSHLRGVMVMTFAALLPVTLAAAAGVIAVELIQTRGALAWSKLQPKGSHLDPVAGIRRLFDSKAVGRLVVSLLKVVVLGVVAGAAALRLMPLLQSLPTLTPVGIAVAVGHAAQGFLLQTGVAFLVLAAVDYGWQWWQHERSLRMSKQDVRDELKEGEGDPHIKARMLAIARARARRRMLHDVPKADVVVVNPTHIAVALRFDPAEARAPVVLAMGQRKLAERIRAIATRAGVPVVQNLTVARALFASSKVGQVIPPALYAAVAEILAFVYRQRLAAGRPMTAPIRRPR